VKPKLIFKFLIFFMLHIFFWCVVDETRYTTNCSRSY